MPTSTATQPTSALQAPHWADAVATEILEWQTKHHLDHLHVDDMKTPSGRVHTGALRGVVLHDIVAKTLADRGSTSTSTYIFNDMDPMDALPGYLDPQIFAEHMGKPLFKIPVPELDHCGIDMSLADGQELAELKAVKNFGELYAWDFIHAFRKLGCSQTIVWSHELYQAGQMDAAIKTALDSVDKIRRIYKEVADYELPANWYPFQVICPDCGKVGTTLVSDWDGEQVTFECQPHKVEWAEGCGYQGKISPFGGTGKLLWKVDWPAHWTSLGINVEGAGKDHTSAGGSRDMANRLMAEVFNKVTPFDIPYEWILIRGAKMSSSKGVGTSAREFVRLFPPAVGRFLFTSKFYGQVIDFDPQTMAIPDLFDEYDLGARIHWSEVEGDTRLGRSFALAQVETIPTAHFLPRFRDVAIWMQHPELDLATKFAEIKGSPLTAHELQVLSDRQQYAQMWLDRYASDEFQLRPRPELPVEASKLTVDQLEFLSKVHAWISEQTWDPAELQQKLFTEAKATLGARQGFEAIYLAYLGKKAGPRAAWFLLNLSPELRQQRQEQLAALHQTAQVEHRFSALPDASIFSLDPAFSAAYPSAVVGVAIIRGITIQPSSPELETAKAQLMTELTGLTTDAINQFPEVQSYRRMYKEMGIDWHSRRPSPEALLRRLAQGKELYTVNTCVDAYNLAVMHHRVSVGAFDLAHVQLPTSLKVAEGGEQILLLGDTEAKALKTGEVSYFDQAGPYNLDYNYRDAQRTMVRLETTDILINVDGIHDITREQVEATLAETIELITKYCGGTVEIAGIVTAS